MAPRRKPPQLLSSLEVSTEVGSFLGGTRIRLLEAIAEHGSISQAARHVPISYKAAWDAIDAMNNLAREPLVVRTAGGRQGGGTQLTTYGRKLIAMYRAVECEYQRALDRLSQQVDGHAIDSASIIAFQHELRRMNLRTSARNQFACTVVALKVGDVDCAVHLRIDGVVDADIELVAMITRDSAQQLQLEVGTEVLALFKASAVGLTTNDSLRGGNYLWGAVNRVRRGALNSEVVVDLGQGKSVTAVIPNDSFGQPGIAEGKLAAAVVQSSSIILNLIG